MDITEFVDSALRISPDSEYAVSEDILMDITDCIQNSSFLNDEGATIEARLTTLCDGRHPSWEAFQSKRGPIYVNCSCTASSGGHDVEIALQFGISDDMRNFALISMMLDGRPQSDEYINEFLSMIQEL